MAKAMGKQKKDTKQESIGAVDLLDPPKVSPEIHDQFRRILEVGPEEDVPVALLESYIKYKRLVDLCSAGQVGAKELITLAMPFIPDCEG